MALNSIQKEWEGFSAFIFRKEKEQPSETQLVEMKKAFFAGAWVVINACKEIGEPEIPEEVGVAWFDARNQECLQFKDQLMKDYIKEN